MSFKHINKRKQFETIKDLGAVPGKNLLDVTYMWIKNGVFT